MWKRILNYYNTNQKFHSFVNGLEGAAVSALGSWTGGIPVSKAGWLALGSFCGMALVGFVKRWLQQNVATQGVQVKP